MIKICKIILSYLEENDRFWLNDRLISIGKDEKKFCFQLSIQPHVFFGTSPVASTENFKS